MKEDYRFKHKTKTLQIFPNRCMALDIPPSSRSFLTDADTSQMLHFSHLFTSTGRKAKANCDLSAIYSLV